MSDVCQQFCGANASCLVVCETLRKPVEAGANSITQDSRDTVQGYILYDVLFDYLPLYIAALVVILFFWGLGYISGDITVLLIAFFTALLVAAAMLKNNVTSNYLINRIEQTRTDFINAVDGALIGNPLPPGQLVRNLLG